MFVYHSSISRFLKTTLVSHSSRRRFGLITLGFIALTLVLSPVEGSAQEVGPNTRDASSEKPPRVGLRVLEVAEGSPAQKAGLQPRDVIVKFGDFAVVDFASYFGARDVAEKSRAAKVAVVYWRGRERIETLMAGARLGIRFNDYNPVADELGIFITEFTSTLGASENNSGTGAAKSRMRSAEKIQADARAIIERAVLDGTLTPAQVLAAKISIIADNAPADEIEKQTEMLKELLSNQSSSFASYLGYEVFFHQRRYRPAIECFKRSLSATPSDANTRLNLGLAYIELGMFSEADDAASYVFNDRITLTGHGLGIAFQIKAVAALGQRDFVKAVDYAEKAFQHEPTRIYLMSLWQLAAAQTGDLQKFYQVIEATDKTAPQDYPNPRARTDAIEAYALAKANQIDKAREIVRRGMGRTDLDLNVSFWKQYPGGDDVAKCWKDLQGQN
jgi:tetratricopeptide (TPR) repeat protein